MDSNKDLCQVPPNFRRDVNNRCDILKVKAAESLCRNKKKKFNVRLRWEGILYAVNLASEAAAIWINGPHAGCLLPMAMLCCLVPFTYPCCKCNCLGNQLEIMGKSVHWPQLLMDKYPDTWASKCSSAGLCCRCIKDLQQGLSVAICGPMEMSRGHKH